MDESVHDIERTQNAEQRYGASEEGILSKDDYIKELEAQVKRLQSREGKAYKSNTVVPFIDRSVRGTAGDVL